MPGPDSTNSKTDSLPNNLIDVFAGGENNNNWISGSNPISEKLSEMMLNFLETTINVSTQVEKIEELLSNSPFLVDFGRSISAIDENGVKSEALTTINGEGENKGRVAYQAFKKLGYSDQEIVFLAENYKQDWFNFFVSALQKRLQNSSSAIQGVFGANFEFAPNASKVVKSVDFQKRQDGLYYIINISNIVFNVLDKNTDEIAQFKLPGKVYAELRFFPAQSFQLVKFQTTTNLLSLYTAQSPMSALELERIMNHGVPSTPEVRDQLEDQVISKEHEHAAILLTIQTKINEIDSQLSNEKNSDIKNLLFFLKDTYEFAMGQHEQRVDTVALVDLCNRLEIEKNKIVNQYNGDKANALAYLVSLVELARYRIAGDLGHSSNIDHEAIVRVKTLHYNATLEALLTHQQNITSLEAQLGDSKQVDNKHRKLAFYADWVGRHQRRIDAAYLKDYARNQLALLSGKKAAIQIILSNPKTPDSEKDLLEAMKKLYEAKELTYQYAIKQCEEDGGINYRKALATINLCKQLNEVIDKPVATQSEETQKVVDKQSLVNIDQEKTQACLNLVNDEKTGKDIGERTILGKLAEALLSVMRLFSRNADKQDVDLLTQSKQNSGKLLHGRHVPKLLAQAITGVHDTISKKHTASPSA